MAARALSSVLTALGAPPAAPTANGKQQPPPPLFAGSPIVRTRFSVSQLSNFFSSSNSPDDIQVTPTTNTTHGDYNKYHTSAASLYHSNINNSNNKEVMGSSNSSPPASPSSSTSISSAKTVVVENPNDEFFSPTAEKYGMTLPDPMLTDKDASYFINQMTHESDAALTAMAIQPVKPTQRDAYDLVIPIVALGSVTIVFLGPLLFPKAYSVFLVLYFATFFTLSCSHLIKFSKTVSKMYANLSDRRPADIEAAGLNNGLISPSSKFDYCHVFLIPNYNEPLPLLQKTIGRLASHKNARTNYVIVLAMEESEGGNHIKSEALVKEFESRFLQVVVTVHPIGIPGEARGKGSNVNYAARRACQVLIREGIPMRSQIFTVSDSDSAIPELYVINVERELAAAPDPLNLVFCPPIFFSRNAFSVPAAVRVTDIMWSVMVMQNLSNVRGITFPCSTYSLSATLADRVGYWDTDFSAIGEDLHMYLKCFFKTDGEARGVPIYVPINLTNVQTPGFVNNMHARYVQAKRHYFGLADTAYTIREARRLARRASRTSTTYLQGMIDRFLVCFHVLEAHAVPASSGWMMMLAVPLFQALAAGVFVDDKFYSNVYFAAQALGAIAGLPLLLCAFVYEGLHRHVDSTLLGKTQGEGRGLKYLLDYCWLPVSAFLFLTIPSTEASIRRLTAVEEKYVTAEKSGIDDN
ncbi:hypothetical protein SmJEL517_g01493 [Synchytrium microbalum]|uniref:Glycosyltransferase 2-like domain-containing protein n=1 Tax=Synchytrium microbalum TaxID=1806994 RepID=A0A507CDS6_9FUNG|nr:uncharacterized protein SmJEL517_g01493 [Synchytrium microbalum]TPX36196.1 hypothetical protein SmJEL517_g01493 [Synchytrium microbalum]